MNTSKRTMTIWIITFILIWEFITNTILHNNGLIPSFSKVIDILFAEILTGDLLEATTVSISLALIGYLTSLLMSIMVAGLCIRFSVLKSLFATLYKILSPLPSVAILPIVFIVCGLNATSIVILIFHAVFWPVLAHNVMGFSTIPDVLKDFADNIQMSFFSKVFNLFIPASIPHLVTGMRTSWGRAWRSLISAEAIFGISGNTQGIGYYIYYHRSFANMGNVFAGILIIIIISLTIEEIFSSIEKNTIKKWGVKNE